MMLAYLTDLIRISPIDPFWVTLSLIAARSVTFCVIATWVWAMVLGQLRGAGRPSLPLSWPWLLIGWMFAVAVQLVISVTRVLVIGHIREQNIIGEGYRMVEIASAVHLGCWSLVAFWRWAHPLQSVSAEGVFASLAASMSMIVSDNTGTIVYATPAFNGLAGYDGDELIGKNLVTIIPAQFRDAHKHGLGRFLTTGESHIIGQVVPLDLLRKDGTELPIYLALATADVDGQPWFCGSAWRQTGAIERQQSARGEQQDAREDGLDVRADEADKRGKLQDERDEARTRQDVAIGDVIKQTAEDVSIVKQDVKTVRAKIVAEDAP